MEKEENNFQELESWTELLKAIDQKLESEIKAKQQLVDRQEKEIENLRFLNDEKNKSIFQLNEKMEEAKRRVEGNRQLINKLLFDIERLQQDIDWYKRTYETRSLLGTIKEKLFKK